MRYILVILFFLGATPLYAGTHYNYFDDFTGITVKVFRSTELEYKSSGVYYELGQYNKKNRSITFLARPGSGSSSCGERNMLIKDSLGKIYEVYSKKEDDVCYVYDLSVDVVKRPFRVRMPMYYGDFLDFYVDTTTLDLSKL